ncbi:hypothetical protein BJ508DRAFT_417923, partial [Ascobolus immersus RN42]
MSNLAATYTSPERHWSETYEVKANNTTGDAVDQEASYVGALELQVRKLQEDVNKMLTEEMDKEKAKGVVDQGQDTLATIEKDGAEEEEEDD